jgi:hypothetical protein
MLKKCISSEVQTKRSSQLALHCKALHSQQLAARSHKSSNTCAHIVEIMHLLRDWSFTVSSYGSAGENFLRPRVCVTVCWTTSVDSANNASTVAIKHFKLRGSNLVSRVYRIRISHSPIADLSIFHCQCRSTDAGAAVRRRSSVPPAGRLENILVRSYTMVSSSVLRCVDIHYPTVTS